MFGYRPDSRLWGVGLFFFFAGMFWCMSVFGRVFVKTMLDFGGDRCLQLYS